MDDMPDVPLDNFGADTEVAAPPAAEPEQPQGDTGEQTAQPTDANGSDGDQAGQPAQPDDNPIAQDTESSGRPEKRDRLQARFGELTKQQREQQAYIEQLEAQLSRNQAMAGVRPLQPDEDGQYSIEQLQQYQAQQAQAIAQAEVSNLRQQLEREQVANKWDAEGAQIETELRTKGLTDQTHLDNIQAEITERVALANNNLNALKQISPSKIAERYIKAIESERRRASSTTATNVQNLQSEAAVTPSGAPAPVDPNSDDALEARVAELKF